MMATQFKKTQIAPFASNYTPNLPELLLKLNCSLAVTTYQAGKVLFISPNNPNSLSLLPRTFNKAMGIAVKDNRMAVATKSEVVVLQNSPELAASYPKKPNTYDALFLPQATYYTGQVDIHDLHFGKEELWAVNTSFSCLCTIDDKYNFTPQWKPHFISKLASEDRCHLNGLAMKNGVPQYISALGGGDTPQSWRENIKQGGIIMDIPNNEIIAQGLSMPHTPRLWNDELYVLLSAAEKLVKVNPKSGTYETVAHIGGFARGMAKHGDFVFIGTSKLRKNSSTFKHLDIADKANHAGITVIHLPTGNKVAQLIFQMTVDEIYDIQILPNCIRPNILNTYTNTHINALSIPESTYWANGDKV
jgi:uncharacterized protein (TIGR03032 family)